jgi:hypothetical protein
MQPPTLSPSDAVNITNTLTKLANAGNMLQEFMQWAGTDQGRRTLAGGAIGAGVGGLGGAAMGGGRGALLGGLLGGAGGAGLGYYGADRGMTPSAPNVDLAGRSLQDAQLAETPSLNDDALNFLRIAQRTRNPSIDSGLGDALAAGDRDARHAFGGLFGDARQSLRQGVDAVKEAPARAARGYYDEIYDIGDHAVGQGADQLGALLEQVRNFGRGPSQ